MTAIQILDQRSSVWQWDTGVKIKVYGCNDVDQMHFETPEGLISRAVVDDECIVPDTALQTAGVLKMYAYDRNEAGGITRTDFTLLVRARPKPADYIDPPDEVDNLQALAERVAPLIPGGGGGEPVTPEQIQQAVDNYLDENSVQIEETDPTVPEWAKSEKKPTYTAEEVGAQPKGNYALKSDIPAVPVQSVNGKTGEVKLSASDVGALPANAEIVDATARAGVAENKQKVAELTEEIAKIPEPYTLPVASANTLGGVKVGEGLSIADDGTLRALNGGESEGEYELIETITLDEDTKRIIRTEDLNGNEYNLSSLFVFIKFPFAEEAKDYGYLNVQLDTKTIKRAYSQYTTATKVHVSTTQQLVATVYAKIKGGVSDGKNTVAMSNSLSTDDRQTGVATIYVGKEKYNRVACETGTAFPAGTTIEIWGVRA